MSSTTNYKVAVSCMDLKFENMRSFFSHTNERFATLAVAINNKTAELSQRRPRDAHMGALKSFGSPHYAPDYFSKNL